MIDRIRPARIAIVDHTLEPRLGWLSSVFSSAGYPVIPLCDYAVDPGGVAAVVAWSDYVVCTSPTVIISVRETLTDLSITTPVEKLVDLALPDVDDIVYRNALTYLRHRIRERSDFEV